MYINYTGYSINPYINLIGPPITPLHPGAAPEVPEAAGIPAAPDGQRV